MSGIRLGTRDVKSTCKREAKVKGEGGGELAELDFVWSGGGGVAC